MAHLKINNPSKGVVSAACQKQPYKKKTIRHRQPSWRYNIPVRSYSISWLEEFVCKKGTADEYYSRSLLHGHLGKYMFKHTPKKNITTTILLVISPLSIHRSIYLHCIHSIPLKNPHQIRPYFKPQKNSMWFQPIWKICPSVGDPLPYMVQHNCFLWVIRYSILCYSNTQFYILPDIHSDSSSGIFIWHFICMFFGHLIWHSIYHVSDILSGIRHSISHVFWYTYRYVIAHSGIFSARNRRWRCLVKISGSPGKRPKNIYFFCQKPDHWWSGSSSSPHFMDILW